MSNKIHFFDCDETIWTSNTKDYISRVPSSLSKIDEDTILREEDDLVFTLKPWIRNLRISLKKQDISIGIVSDNLKEPVLKALELFELQDYIDSRYINIKLWDGYCPKHLMIQELISKYEHTYSEVFWRDDKDYSEEAKIISAKFNKISESFDLSMIADCCR